MAVEFTAPACSDAAKLKQGGTFVAMPDGVHLWYRFAGKEGAPVILFLHGGPGYNAFTFERSAGKELEAAFRVLYVDQRGCGRSGFEGAEAQYGMIPTVDDLDRLRETVGAPRMTIIAHSFGGAVAAEYTRKFADRVSAVVLVDTTTNIGAALEHQVRFIDSLADRDLPEQAAEIHKIAKRAGSPFERISALYAVVGRLPIQRRLHFSSTDQQDRAEELDEESGLLGCTSSKVVSAFASASYLDEGPASLRAPLGVPTLVIAGRNSEVIGKANVEAGAKLWKARIAWMNTGHFAYLEAPKEFSAVVSSFLQESAR